MIIRKIGILITMILISVTGYAYDFEFDGIYYNVTSLQDMTCEVTWCPRGKDYKGSISIPSEVTFDTLTLTVSSIGETAFWEAYELISIELPNSVTSIGNRAFMDCSALESINIPNSVKDIDRLAFLRCSSLKSIHLSDQLESITGGLFNGCSSLENMIVPGSVQYFSLEYIDSYKWPTFDGCENLKSFRFSYSENPLEIGTNGGSNGHFQNTTWDTYIKNSTERITELYIDRPLSEVIPVPNVEILEIGSSMRNIPVKSMEAIISLKKIQSHALTPPTLPELTNQQYINIEVIVPQAALETYRQAPSWKKFWNIQGSSGLKDNQFDNTKVVTSRVSLNGSPVDEDYKGFVIVRFSDGSARKMVQK